MTENQNKSSGSVYLSVVIPTFNGAEVIPTTLVDIDRILSRENFTYEIIVVNDGSKDNTAEIVRKMAGTIKNLVLIDNAENKGKGGVTRQGMLAARGLIRVFTDDDNATSVDHIKKMFPFFEQGYGVVICSRAVKGTKLDPPEPWFRQIPGKVGNLIIQVLLLPGIWDTQCGFKAFSAKAAEAVFEPARMRRWSFDVEVLSLAKKYGFKIKEIPVHWVRGAVSRISAGVYLQFLLEVFKIRLWLWQGKYPAAAPNKSK